MHIVFSGGTGFVGQHVTRALIARGDEVTLLVRSDSDTRGVATPVKTVPWSATDQTSEGRAAMASADAVVNLAGASVVDQRWTEARIRVLHDSRVLTTRGIAKEMRPDAVLVSSSAIGYYGMRTDDAELDESSPPGDDVLARICVDWENAAREARSRVVLMRTGIVLGREGGAFAKLVPMFRRFVGGPLGSGKQWYSWLHIEDMVRAYLFAIDTPTLEGPVNGTAPTPRTMNDVARALGDALHRPHAMRVPAFALKLALGDAAEVLLTGQRALPKRLLAAGFEFRFTDLDLAVRDLVK